MNNVLAITIDISEQYPFSKEALDQIDENTWIKNHWPIIYFIRNDSKKRGYIGESSKAKIRIRTHLDNPKKNQAYKTISIIGSDQFNKSATLDIESQLIQYITADATYELENSNRGQVLHNYYQRDLYKEYFREIWKKLTERKIVSRSLKEIENSELFKFSPFKTLNEDQYNAVLHILETLTSPLIDHIIVKGTAGTGKTVLATYLIKLLLSNVEDPNLDDYNADELREINGIKKFQEQYPKKKIGFVVAMTSLRTSLENVFEKIHGLKKFMILSPSDTIGDPSEKYDLLIVDEAHRLRQYQNISWRGAFRQNNLRQGLDDNGTELEWVLLNSKKQIFIYDALQSIKPSDIDERKFDDLLNRKRTSMLELKSQMRVLGGIDYINYVEELLNVTRKPAKFYARGYDLIFFDSLRDLYKELAKKEAEVELCRLVAGFSWPWLSKPQDTRKSRKIEDKQEAKADPIIDIEIEGLKFQWNTTDKDWIYSPSAFREIGCIHTVQGYDLNYTGLIFGREIDYNEKTHRLEINADLYFDTYGKAGIDDPQILKRYIINIYRNIMYRGIRGTYVYACNEGMRTYLKKHMLTAEDKGPFRMLLKEDVKPWINSVPLFDIKVAAGKFSESQIASSEDWIELPIGVAMQEGYFVCRVVGDSMNERIPNGSWCLFQQDQGGSRDGKIVLVQHSKVQDQDSGSSYTVKYYHSEKFQDEDGWGHKRIVLKPSSTLASYENIVLEGHEQSRLNVVGIFVKVLA